MNAAQAARSCAAQQPKQERFGLIVFRVRDRNRRSRRGAPPRDRKTRSAQCAPRVRLKCLYRSRALRRPGARHRSASAAWRRVRGRTARPRPRRHREAGGSDARRRRRRSVRSRRSRAAQTAAPPSRRPPTTRQPHGYPPEAVRDCGQCGGRNPKWALRVRSVQQVRWVRRVRFGATGAKRVR